MSRQTLSGLSFVRNSLVEWHPYNGEKIIECFQQRQWHMIFPYVDTENELKELLEQKFGMGYVVYSKKNNTPKGFAYLHITDTSNNKVFIHGGSWSNNAIFNYSAMTTMIDALFNVETNVRSSCLIENNTAYRFLRSLGFIKYHTSQNFHYLWLPYKRFVTNSLITRNALL